MTMEKKVYIAPAIELFEMESEGCLLQASAQIGSGTQTIGDGDGDGFVDAMSNKRQPNNTPWSSSPWE